MKITLALLLTLLAPGIYGQEHTTEVLTLGVFHFAFPNLDVRKTAKSDQIDVLDGKYQDEMEEIVERIARFKPTIIAVERDPDRQSRFDSLYQEYLKGKYQLGRNEDEQIGFRLAKRLGLKKLYCVNDWGVHYDNVNRLFDGRDTAAAATFEEYFYHNPDTAKKYFPKDVLKSEGILAELRIKNDEDNIRRDLGNYLIGPFKYATAEDEFFGADFTTGQWFNRNLRIFRNIQKINASPADRIVVIFGAGHMNLLNLLFDASPEYKRARTNDYLK